MRITAARIFALYFLLHLKWHNSRFNCDAQTFKKITFTSHKPSVSSINKSLSQPVKKCTDVNGDKTLYSVSGSAGHNPHCKEDLTLLSETDSSPITHKLHKREVAVLSEQANHFRLLLEHEYYVDKSELIRVILEDPELYRHACGIPVILTLPKRFGKSTNMRMIKTFCEIEMRMDNDSPAPVAQDFSHVINTPNYGLFTKDYGFGKLKIAQNDTFMKNHFGKYPVIYLDFHAGGITRISSEEMLMKSCALVIQKAFIAHKYLIQSNILDEREKMLVKQWYTMEHIHLDRSVVVTGLRELSRVLYKHFNQKIIILIDEYDLPITQTIMRCAHDEVLLYDILSFYSTIFSTALKDFVGLHIALFTGVTHIAGAALTAVLPKIQFYLFARNSKFYQYFGFTEDDIDYLFKKAPFSLDDNTKQLAKDYYDGYLAEGKSIFTPESIISFLMSGKIEPSWTEPSNSVFLFPALRFFTIRQKVLDLVDNKSVEVSNLPTKTLRTVSTLQRCILRDSIKPNELYDEEDLSNVFLNFLWDTGYLKIITKIGDDLFIATIPNIEIRNEIKRMLHNYLINRDNYGEISHIEDNILSNLQSIDTTNFQENLQAVCDKLNELSEIVIKPRHNFKEENLKDIFRQIFHKKNVRFYTEVTLPKPDSDSKTMQSVFADLLIRDFSNVYIIMEFKYKTSSEDGLKQIIDNYLPTMESIEYGITQEYCLLLGISLDSSAHITISANYTNYKNQKTIYRDRISRTGAQTRPHTLYYIHSDFTTVNPNH